MLVKQILRRTYILMPPLGENVCFRARRYKVMDMGMLTWALAWLTTPPRPNSRRNTALFVVLTGQNNKSRLFSRAVCERAAGVLRKQRWPLITRCRSASPYPYVTLYGTGGDMIFFCLFYVFFFFFFKYLRHSRSGRGSVSMMLHFLSRWLPH